MTARPDQTRRHVIHVVAGARPNFLKVAPLLRAFSGQAWAEPVFVNTGQHYDRAMADAFFRDLALPPPDFDLGVGSGSHAEQTARIMVAYEKACLARRPDWTIVVGDVNSTVAAALVATKLSIRVAHLEAGLRSGDRAMPEEINRLVTDAIADLLWTPSPDADDNLRREGVPRSRIERVGNIMIDSYEMLRPSIQAANVRARFELEKGGYGIVTLHRPSNVDDRDKLAQILEILDRAARRLPLIFPVHPRTRAQLLAHGLDRRLRADGHLMLTEPMGYIDFMSLVEDARMVLTDSGGIQEETTYLGIPCLTLRDNTERPITVTEGTNRLIAVEGLEAAIDATLESGAKSVRRPALWDGRTAARCIASLSRHLSSP